MLNSIDEDKKILGKSVIDFITSYNSIYIPDYQRPYSWETKNLDELWKDIDNLIQDSSLNKNWFFGPIFTTRFNNDKTSIELLDGQQRITTIFILIAESLHVIKNKKLNDFEDDVFNANLLISNLSNLLTVIGGQLNASKSKLVTEKYLKGVFNDYIINAINFKQSVLDDKAQKKVILENFDRLNNQGYTSAYAFIKTINFFEEKFNLLFNEIHTKQIKWFNDFLNVILYNFWFIEIPLQSKEKSLEIFETINSRGKTLSLSDKIKFQLLKNIKKDDTIIDKRNLLEKVDEVWYNLFQKLEFLKDNTSLISSEDEFFVLFAVSKTADGSINKNDLVLQFLENEYFIHGENGIKKLLEQLEILSVDLYHIFKLDVNNLNIPNLTSKNKKVSKAVLNVLIKGLKTSKNARFLLFHIILSDKDLISNSFRITKLILSDVLIQTRSNNIRNKYLSFIKHDNIPDIKSEDILSDIKSLVNFLFTNNNLAQFICYFTCINNNIDVLHLFNLDEYNSSTLEHFIPKKWETNWRKIEYKDSDISYSLECLDKEALKLEYDCYDLFVRTIVDYLKPLSANKPENIEYTIIEIIGNKWSIAENINQGKLKNKSQKEKLEILNQTLTNQLPARVDKKLGTGLLNVNNFDLTEVLNRSINFLNECLKSLDTRIEDLKG